MKYSNLADTIFVMAIEQRINGRPIEETIVSLDFQHQPNPHFPAVPNKEKEVLIERIVFLERELGRARNALQTAQKVIQAVAEAVDERIEDAFEMEREVEVRDGNVIHRSEQITLYSSYSQTLHTLDRTIQSGL